MLRKSIENSRQFSMKKLFEAAIHIYRKCLSVYLGFNKTKECGVFLKVQFSMDCSEKILLR